MTYTHMTRLMATAAGLLGSAAFVALASLPGVAQSTVSTQESNSETRTYTYPGPSETPSGSPSVPGTSTVDDPGAVQESQPDQEARRDSSSTPQNPTVEPYGGSGDSGVEPAEIPSGSDQGASDTDMNSSLPASSEDLIAQSSRGEEVEDGPSAVDEGVPGPSETPSGSPSVPGVSEVDDPGLENSQEGNRPTVERDAMNTPSSSDSGSGPSAVPGEGVPGPSETPSGSPSVPGVSVYDDPNDEPRPEMGTPGQGSMDDSRQDGPSAVPGEGVPGPSETPSGSPSVPGTSSVDDPGVNNN